jgi:hypothetical protein
MKQNTKINTKNTKLRNKSKKTQKLNKHKNTKNKNTICKISGGVKTPRDYGYDDKYNIFLDKLKFEDDNQIRQCRSTRGNKLTLETKSLGSTNKNSFISPINLVSEKELKGFVNQDIKDGAQIVSVPVPPFRHAFLVNILPNKIMISDWKGNNKLQELQKLQENTRQKRQTRQKNQPIMGTDYTQYYDFMKLLEQKYPGRPIKFYNVNGYLQKEALKKNEKFDGGGCAEYIYMWVEGILNADKTFFSR